ncbi:hypothetical protein HWC80_gp057 [Mycobacterium phage Indlulamithi]|uniref:Uncharacterized protein n=1 Tax=Mycobacterium phage Indlulamithi TaxID=2656582 RepID=A0A649VCR1_9CAUD|nr:hypothetical protein HWC80_gp057 [Mycobacterium phage Indlulamithi]QGJ90096.1 hypothetical protein PBI_INDLULAMITHI_57 [Mycobacterium phage Indlulamithi]
MYSVTVQLNHVKDSDDLLLQLVRLQMAFNQDVDWLAKLAQRTNRGCGPFPLAYKGIQRIGTIEVMRNG